MPLTAAERRRKSRSSNLEKYNIEKEKSRQHMSAYRGKISAQKKAQGLKALLTDAERADLEDRSARKKAELLGEWLVERDLSFTPEVMIQRNIVGLFVSKFAMHKIERGVAEFEVKLAKKLLCVRYEIERSVAEFEAKFIQNQNPLRAKGSMDQPNKVSSQESLERFPEAKGSHAPVMPALNSPQSQDVASNWTKASGVKPAPEEDSDDEGLGQMIYRLSHTYKVRIAKAGYAASGENSSFDSQAHINVNPVSNERGAYFDKTLGGASDEINVALNMSINRGDHIQIQAEERHEMCSREECSESAQDKTLIPTSCIATAGQKFDRWSQEEHCSKLARSADICNMHESREISHSANAVKNTGRLSEEEALRSTRPAAPLPALAPALQLRRLHRRALGRVAQRTQDARPPPGPRDERRGVERLRHCVFLDGYSQHGKGRGTIAAAVGTRPPDQVRSHAQYPLKKRNRATANHEDSPQRQRLVEVDEVVAAHLERRKKCKRDGCTKLAQGAGICYMHEAMESPRSAAAVKNSGPWSQEESRLFLDAYSQFGKGWVKIAAAVGTRSPDQVRSHAQKLRQRLGEVDEVVAAHLERRKKCKRDGCTKLAQGAGICYMHEAMENPSSADVVKNSGPWSQEEHRRFLYAYSKFGEKWVKITAAVRTRSRTQVRSHAQKFLQKSRATGLI